MTAPDDAPDAAAGLDAFHCAAFVMLAFVLAGFAQTAWLRCRLSRRFHVPIDAGRSLRGKRIFGDNKTWGGFLVMVPAVGVLFLFFSAASRLLLPDWGRGLWPLS